MKVFRVARRKYAGSVAEMLSGEGAEQYGGRWNSVGVPAIYCSESLSLCALEILVHLPRGVLGLYNFLEIEVPDNRIQQLDAATPKDIIHSQQIGDSLLGADGVLAFSACSIVNPLERNVIINPVHADFNLLQHGKVQPFPIDERLLKR